MLQKQQDIEVKNNLAIARGEWGGMVGKGVFKNYYKGHMDKTKGEWKQGREVGINRVGGRHEGDKQTTVIEQH